MNKMNRTKSIKKIMERISAAIIIAVIVVQCFPTTVFAYQYYHYGTITTPSAGGTVSKYADFNTNWACDTYSFTPSYSGWYTFYSVRSSGDPYFYLTTSGNYSTVLNAVVSAGCKSTSINSYTLAYNDDGNGNLNFLVSNYYLTAGTTYYVILTKYSTASTVYNFYVNRANSYYNVAYNANGGTGSMSSQTMEHHRSYNLTNNAFTRDEYTFAGWNTTSAGTGTNYSNSQQVTNMLWSYGGTVTLYAKWAPNSYTVTLDRGSGTGGSTSVSGSYGASSMPSITRPKAPTGHTFQGYYTSSGGSGTKYYNADGSSAHKFDFTTSTANKAKNTTLTLYAYYAPQEYTLTLNNQGGSGGNSAPLVYGAEYPASVTVPTRVGYVFDGYYGVDRDNVIDLNDKYYDGDGQRVKPGNFTGSSNVTVYARWLNETVTLTVDLGDEGTWTDWDGDSKNGSETYSLLGNVQKAVTNIPTKADHIFAGWVVTGNARFNDTTKILTLDSTMSATQEATLTAQWNSPESLVTVPVGDENAVANKDALTEMYNTDNLVTDPEFGITSEELPQSPKLKLTINPITAQPGDGEHGSSFVYESTGGNHNAAVQSLINNASGIVPNSGAIFDVYVEKTVGSQTPIRLKQVAVPVAIVIPLSSTPLYGHPSYQVWHFHENSAEQVPEATAADGLSQWFEFDTRINPTKITVYLTRFSEILVSCGTAEMIGQGMGADIIWDDRSNTGLDVQGKVLENSELTYKVDISWGAMVFEFSKGALWDPDRHEYAAAAINDWLPEGFTDGNNEITVYNHSNGGLFVNFNIKARTGDIPINGSSNIDLTAALGGVDMKVRIDNDNESAEALNMQLPKVAYSGDTTAPSINAFVRLTGTPANVADLDKANKHQETSGDGEYLKLATVTVTLSPDTSSGRTPLSTPPVTP